MLRFTSRICQLQINPWSSFPDGKFVFNLPFEFNSSHLSKTCKNVVFLLLSRMEILKHVKQTFKHHDAFCNNTLLYNLKQYAKIYKVTRPSEICFLLL